MKSHSRMLPRILHMAIASFLLSNVIGCQPAESGKESEAAQPSESSASSENAEPSDVAFELNVPLDVKEQLADVELNEDEVEKVKDAITTKLGKIGGGAVNVICSDKNNEGEKKKTFGFLYLSLDVVGGIGTALSHVNGEAEDGYDLAQKDAQSQPKKKPHPKHKIKGFGGLHGRSFIPLHCTSNLKIELKGLTEGTLYQLTAQFYSLSKKVKFAGVTKIAYPGDKKVDLVMSPVKDGQAIVNVIFDEDKEGEDKEDEDKEDEEGEEEGTLKVNFKGKTGKDVGLVAMSTDGKCGVKTYKAENQCGDKQLWKSAAFSCQAGETFAEKSVLCREPGFFKKLAETKCLNSCSNETLYKEVVSTKESTIIELPTGPYWIMIRSNIEKDLNIDKTKVYIRGGGTTQSVDLTL